MRVAFTLLAALCPALVAAAPASTRSPIDALDAGFPKLVAGLESDDQTCAARHALKPDEVASPWRGRVADIAMQCSSVEGVNGEPDVSIDAQAKVIGGTVQLGGVPVREVRLSNSWAGDDKSFTLVGRYADLYKKLGPMIRARCVQEWKKSTGSATGWCAMRGDPIHGGLFVEAGELGGVWLHPDPDNPNQTIYADAWSE